MTEAGEIETHDGNPGFRQRAGYPRGGIDSLGAGEAMGKQRIGARCLVRRIESRRKHLARMSGKFELLCTHLSPQGLHAAPTK
jgi:hypothetical protein